MTTPAVAADETPARQRIEDVADDAKLYEPQVAALFGWSPRTVKKYKLSGRLPAPDGDEKPPGRPWTDQAGSGPPSDYWFGATIKAHAATLQPPGRPRADGQPRQRRKDTYAKPGPKPGQAAGTVTAIRAALDELGGAATDAELMTHLAGQGHEVTEDQLRSVLVDMGRRRPRRPR
jgi:hypothetical protein